jgi:hypothetical protein
MCLVQLVAGRRARQPCGVQIPTLTHGTLAVDPSVVTRCMYICMWLVLKWWACSESYMDQLCGMSTSWGDVEGERAGSASTDIYWDLRLQA